MTTFIWNPNASGDWSDKNDWSPLGPPTAGSDVIISTLIYQTVTYSSGTETVNSLTVGNDLFQIDGGQLTIASAASFAATALIDGGTLVVRAKGTATFSDGVTFGVAGGLAGVGATLSGAGVTATSGTTTVEDETPGYDPLSLENAAKWVNTGTVDDAGVIYVEDNNSKIDNQFGGVFDLTTDYASFYSGDGDSVFDNEGTLTKTSGSGVSKIDVKLDTTGVVSASSGTLEFDGGGSLAGTFSTSGSGVIALGSGTFRAGATKVTLGGGVEVDGGILSPGAGKTLTLSGTVAFGVAGGLAGVGATLYGAGVTATSGTTTVEDETPGYDPLSLENAAKWVNTGTVDDAGVIYVEDNNSKIDNQFGGVFDLTTDYASFYSGDGDSVFDNEGTLTKTSGSGVSKIDVKLDTTGVVSASSGTLEFDGGGSLAGTFSTSGSGVIALGSGTFRAGATKVTLGGGVEVDGGILSPGAGKTLTLSGTVAFGVAGGLAGVGATLYGAGVTATSGTTTVEDETPGYDPLSLENAAKWVNTGTVDDAGVIYVEDNNSKIDNQFGGVFDLTTDHASFYGGDGDTVFDNEGTLAKISGSGVSKIDPQFDTTGVVWANSGTLEFDGGGSFAGLINGGAAISIAGASVFRILKISGGLKVINSSTITQEGNLTLGAVFVNDAGATYTIANASVISALSGGSFSNAGYLYKSGTSASVIGVAIQNSGTIEVQVGSLDLEAAVTGAGLLEVYSSGTLELGAAAKTSEDVEFSGSSLGTLHLNDLAGPSGQLFHGAVSNFASGDRMDIGAPFGKGTHLSFAANANSTAGVLTVTNGQHQASFELIGDYLAASFTLTADGRGGMYVGYKS